MLQAQKLPSTVNYACVIDEFVMRPEADVAISPAATTGGGFKRV